MAKSNRDRISDVMDTLRDGLGPYVLREYKMRYKAGGYLAEIEDVLNTRSYQSGQLADEADALATIDVMGWLNLFIRRWDEVFRQKLGHAERSYVSELITARHDWAHQQPFSNEDAYRVADTATRLLKSIGVPKQAEATEAIAKELLRLRFEAEQKRARKAPEAPDGIPTLTLKGLRPWRHVVKPHPDVASGRYIQAEFAADLAQVHKGEADPEYGDPHEFFRRTYLTDGLVSLLATGVKRLNGIGGDPVVQLQTSFGGGKTHSMLALYHLFSGKIGLSQIPGGEQITAQVGEVDDKLVANRAVVVGTAFDATEPRVYADVTTHTIWGDIAYQLGGADGYALVRQADLAGVSPGSDTLVQLLEAHGPALIIIDELVAFARNLYGVPERLAAGSFEAVMTFVQALTEAVRRASDAILLVSIPQSKIEIGGDGGQAALDILSNTIGRLESVWKPVTANESFEIVRRRLFDTDIDYAARDAVLSEFQKLYAQNSSTYPSGVAEGDYLNRMRAAYPIHPELFDRLYQDWSTLEKFQRTRGVLRLMAAVIHALWFHDDQSLLIMPASVPLSVTTVRDEMLRYLPENWPAIVDTDIDGSESYPVGIDKSVPALGQYAAARRVARTIFVGSAPSVTGQSVRGVEEVRINLGAIQPGEPSAIFGDALRRLSSQLTYLYSDGSRYWYDTRPTVTRIARDRAQRVPLDDVHAEIVQKLRKLPVDKRDFAGVHIAPTGPADVADDETRVRLVVLGPDAVHKRNLSDSAAMQNVAAIFESRGSAARNYRNMLVFVAPDAANAEALEAAVRDYLAWDSIDTQQEELNLDAQQRKQVRTNLDRAQETVGARLLETYNWLIVPEQPDPTGPVQFQAYRISGADGIFTRAARKLRQSGMLITEWAPTMLNMELARFLWRDQAHVKLQQVWDDLARYCYLPRLYNQDVLLDAVRAGISAADAPFAYADAVDDQGRYQRLLYRGAGSIYVNDAALLVRGEAAQAQLDREAAAVPAPAGGGADYPDPEPHSSPTHEGGVTPPPAERTPVKRRYYGTVSLNPQRVNRDIDTIVQEVIEHLIQATGSHVRITLEIAADLPAGFSDTTVRAVGENSRTLKFDEYGFEET